MLTLVPSVKMLVEFIGMIRLSHLVECHNENLLNMFLVGFLADTLS